MMAREESGEHRASARPALVSTGVVSGRQGFDWWTQMVSRTVMPVSVASEHADRFKGMATALELTGTEVSAYSFSPMSARRTHTHIRRSDLESYFLFLVHGSPIGLEQRRNNTLLKAGDMAVFDTSQPLECEFQDHGRASRVTLMRLPRSVLPLPGDGMDRLVATPLSVRAGSGALLTSFLAGFRANATQENLPELQRLGATGLELAATLLAAHLDTSPALPVETRRTVLLARINAFIDQNLPDPDLSPATVAAHHHISVRLLHLMFRQEPETVAAAIRRRRLERGRADLADPRLRHRTIAETAARWGYRHPADFSRAFRRAHGISPSDYRHLAQSTD
jgi:AraC-like DNA-binding protein